MKMTLLSAFLFWLLDCTHQPVALESLTTLYKKASIRNPASDCPSEGNQHKYLEAPVDFNNASGAKFRLHYKLQNGFSRDKKTIVMLHGGPGEGLSVFDTGCGTSFCLSELSNEYNIVTVDERGAGCSLLPLDKNRKFLTFSQTVRDLEFIRRSIRTV